MQGRAVAVVMLNERGQNHKSLSILLVFYTILAIALNTK